MDELIQYLHQHDYKQCLFTYRYHLFGALAFVTAIKCLKSYFGGGVCKSKVRLDGKTVLITGANTGIGKETALECAKRGARVILACRDVKKGEEAAVQIRSESGNGNVVVEYLDLASFESVKQFANKVNEKEPFLHVLINNAGLAGLVNRKTINGDIEMTFGVNHVSHFLLTNLLLDKLKASAPSRVVNVSSIAHKNGRFDWDNLMFEKNYGAQLAYRRSKLANVLFTRELAKRLAGTGVTTYSLHPGVVKTEIARNAAEHYGFLYTIVSILLAPIVWLAFKTPKQGAQTTIYCAVDGDLRKANSGGYFSDCHAVKLQAHATNDADAVKLWEVSENLVKDYLH